MCDKGKVINVQGVPEKLQPNFFLHFICSTDIKVLYTSFIGRTVVLICLKIQFQCFYTLWILLVPYFYWTPELYLCHILTLLIMCCLADNRNKLFVHRIKKRHFSERFLFLRIKKYHYVYYWHLSYSSTVSSTFTLLVVVNK